MVNKNKDPMQVLQDLRLKFREATASGVLGGEQRAVFELTLVSILNECEEQRQKCLRLQFDYERDAARAGAQANTFNMMQNMIGSIFGNIIEKVSSIDKAEQEIVEKEAEAKNITEEEKRAIAIIDQRQKAESTSRSAQKIAPSELVRTKTTKKTASR